MAEVSPDVNGASPDPKTSFWHKVGEAALAGLNSLGAQNGMLILPVIGLVSPIEVDDSAATADVSDNNLFDIDKRMERAPADQELDNQVEFHNWTYDFCLGTLQRYGERRRLYCGWSTPRILGLKRRQMKQIISLAWDEAERELHSS